jgi:polyhydroxyalkanoate synthesis regulator protein
MTQAFGATPFGPMVEDLARRNMEMFRQAVSMFTPFARREGEAGPGAEGEKAAAASSGSDLEELRRQLADMQKKVDKLGGGET